MANLNSTKEMQMQQGTTQPRRLIRPRPAEGATQAEIVLDKITRTVLLGFGMLEGLLALRFVFKMIGANPDNPVAAALYGLSGIFLRPFAGLIPNPAIQGVLLEMTTVAAMLVYALIGLGITQLLWILFVHKSE